MNNQLILGLKKFLDDFNYHYLLTNILGENNYFINPTPDYYYVKRELKKVNLKIEKIISFFLLGDPIEKRLLEDNIEVQVIEHLKELNILNSDNNDYWLNNYILTSYCNCYFFVSNVYFYPTCQNDYQRPYIGPDTYWLSRMVVNRFSGTVLDLCTGSGIQGILAAKTSDHVVAVDLDEEACKIAKFNSILNNVYDKFEVVCGDLYDAIDNKQKFDYIISNPPFIPIPKELEFPICGDGGEDGKGVIRTILSGFDTFLKPNGKAIIIGQAIGNEDNVFLSSEIKSIVKECSSKLYLNCKVPIENQEMQFAELAKRFNQCEISTQLWEKIYNDLGANIFYNFTLFCNNDKFNNYEEIYLEDNWSKKDIPITKISEKIKISENYYLKPLKGVGYKVEDEIIEFIKLVDGKKSIYEIIKDMPFRIKVKYGENANEKLIVKYINICCTLSRYNLISRSTSSVDI